MNKPRGSIVLLTKGLYKNVWGYLISYEFGAHYHYLFLSKTFFSTANPSNFWRDDFREAVKETFLGDDYWADVLRPSYRTEKRVLPCFSKTYLTL